MAEFEDDDLDLEDEVDEVGGEGEEDGDDEE